jgi:hypothetical protein
MLCIKSNEINLSEFGSAVKKPIPIMFKELKEEFTVETLEGVMKGKAGDFLMIGVRGEVYPCDREIFLETYTILE